MTMSPTVLEANAGRVHRRDVSHRARYLARTLREPLPQHLPAAFDPAMAEGLPEPARRWLCHAIEPGVLLFEALEVQMRGEIKLGSWRPFTATEAIVPDAGFVWAAHTRVARLPVRGFDSYALGEGRMCWRALGCLPLFAARDYDVTRSAADRLAAEAVLLPTCLVPATWRPGDDADSATYLRHFGQRVSRGRVTIRVAPDGQLLAVSMHRWGNPDGRGYADRIFEVSFGGEYHVDGIVVPDLWSAAWRHADGRRDEFFRAVVDTAEFAIAGTSE